MSTFIIYVAKRLDRINYQTKQQETCVKYYVRALQGLDKSATERIKRYNKAIERHRAIADRLDAKFSKIYDDMTKAERHEVIGLMESMSVN